MLKILGLMVVIAVLGVLAAAQMQPDTFRYERSITIATPPEAIFPYLNTPKLSQQWSPWEKLDPAMKRRFSGPEFGVGAQYAWDGNANVGAGQSEIIRSDDPTRVVMRLDFQRPMRSTSTAEYKLERLDDGTRVTWAMYGANTFPGKLVSLFMDCEKMVGVQFDRGLADLKRLVEA